MAGSVYPGALDDFAESSPTYMSDPDATGRTHEGRHNDVEAAIEQVEETLGVNPQGPNATVAERLTGISSSGPGTGTAFSLPIAVDTAVAGVSAAFIRGAGGARVFLDASGGGFHYFDAVGSNFRGPDGVTTVFSIAANGLVQANGRQVPTHYWDESVGRRLFVWDTINNRWQMVYADTGWRNVAADVLTPVGFQYVELWVRRVGSVCYVKVMMVSEANYATGPQNVYTLPAGFQPQAEGPGSGGLTWQWQASPVGIVYVNWDNVNLNVGSVAGPAGCTVTFTTAQPWPTSLPGVAGGVIPTAENLLPGQADIDGDIPTGLTPDDDTSGWTVTYPDGPTP